MQLHLLFYSVNPRRQYPKIVSGLDLLSTNAVERVRILLNAGQGKLVGVMLILVSFLHISFLAAAE